MEGIFVGTMQEVIPEYFDEWLSIDLNLKSSAVNLDVSRTKIIKNEKLRVLRSDLEKILLGCLKSWVEDYEKRTNDTYGIANQIIKTYINDEIFDHTQTRREIPQDLVASSSLLAFIKQYYRFILFEKTHVYSGSYNDLLGVKRKVTILTGISSNEETYVRSLMGKCESFVENQLFLTDDWCDISRFCDPNRTVFQETIPFESMLSYEVLNKIPLKKVIPKAWKIVRFLNLKTMNIFERIGGGYGNELTFLNADNNFIALLVNRPDVFQKQPEGMTILELFFTNLKKNLKVDFTSIVKTQEKILTWYVESKIIDDVNSYLLKQEQLPHYYTKFQKKPTLLEE